MDCTSLAPCYLTLLVSCSLHVSPLASNAGIVSCRLTPLTYPNLMPHTGVQYSDSGWFTCQLYPGSYLNEYRDAKLFQDWGFDYLKYVCQAACPVEKTLIVTGMTTARV